MNEKTFWRRPEGITGAVLLGALVLGGGFLLVQFLPLLINLAQNTLYLAGMLAGLGLVLYALLDARTRNLVWYMYKAGVRWLTGIFVEIDPISILKSYISDLEDNLIRLSKQIGALRGQMRTLKGTMDTNNADIQKNLKLAEEARKQNDDKNTTLGARKAARLQEANEKYNVLYQKMEVLQRILVKMYENSEIVMEDTKDQVKVKEQEYRAIRTSHTAIQSAMSIMKGNPDQRAMFDQALETMANDVSAKVGEMERFMDTSKNLMDSIDIQSGVLADDGMKMLENFEKSSPLLKNTPAEQTLDLNGKRPELLQTDEEDYKRLFE